MTYRWFTRGYFTEMLEEGRQKTNVSREIVIAQSTVYGFWRAFKKTGLHSSRQGAGRFCDTTASEDKYIVLFGK